MREFGRRALAVVLLLLIAYSFALVIFTFNFIDDLKAVGLNPTGRASAGHLDLCINTPPSLGFGNCNITSYLNNGTLNYNLTVEQGQPYNCTLNGSDADGDSISFGLTELATSMGLSPFDIVHRSFSNSTAMPFNFTNGNFYSNATNDDVGVYIFQPYVEDARLCTNSRSSRWMNLIVQNTNDPPYLVMPIPGQTFYEGETIHAFYLNDYFADPDHDPLSYSVAGNTNVNIQILVGGEVVLSANTCPAHEFVMFTAIDPYNATAYSNLVEINCIKRVAPQVQPGTGAAGGGGGGSSKLCGEPDYICYEYHKCNVSNMLIQHCVDKKGCEDDHFLNLPCLYEKSTVCIEDWVCTDWFQCTPNCTQSRTCTDKNNCGTNNTLPDLQKTCEYVGTCVDGLKNCHDGSCEEGIDCGGPCNACKSVQVPYPIQPSRGWGVYIFTGLILILLAAMLVYHYFKKEINQTLARLGWFLTRKKRKQYLLSKEDQKKLMAELSALEKKLDKADTKPLLFEILNKYNELLRYYLVKVVELGSDFDAVMLEAGLEKRKKKIIPILRTIFRAMFDDYTRVSKDEKRIVPYKIRLLMEELRNIVLQTSQVARGEYSRDVQEWKPVEKDGPREKMLLGMMNTFIALEFIEAEAAKKKYLALIKDYEKISVEDEEWAYEDLRRLYENVEYVNAWAWMEKR